jgi:hypothetical protein
MATLTDLAASRQARLVATSQVAARRALRLWNTIDSADIDRGWDEVAPSIERVVTSAQVTAARQSAAYVQASGELLGAGMAAAAIVPEAFGGATREGRGIAPELYAAATSTKTLIGRGLGVGQAFRFGAAYLSVMAAAIVRDAGRSADGTLSFARGSRFSVRVIQPGACSRCAILAGVKGYRTDFDRHPGCRCTSMPLYDDETPDGFFRDTGDYFESLSEAEQARVFTKAGAEAIRLGADPVKVVNARRGALKSVKRPDGTFSARRLRPVQIGTSKDGSPLLVYATPEGTTARGRWGRGQVVDIRVGADRYRVTSTLRLMPEQIMHMASTPEEALELLKKYGYLS